MRWLNLYKDVISAGLVLAVAAAVLTWSLRYVKAIQKTPHRRAAEISDLKFLFLGLVFIALAFAWEVTLLKLAFVQRMAPLGKIVVVFLGTIVLGSIGAGQVWGWLVRKRELMRSSEND